jgi:hypothetical protein
MEEDQIMTLIDAKIDTIVKNMKQEVRLVVREVLAKHCHRELPEAIFRRTDTAIDSISLTSFDEKYESTAALEDKNTNATPLLSRVEKNDMCVSQLSTARRQEMEEWYHIGYTFDQFINEGFTREELFLSGFFKPSAFLSSEHPVHELIDLGFSLDDVAEVYHNSPELLNLSDVSFWMYVINNKKGTFSDLRKYCDVSKFDESFWRELYEIGTELKDLKAAGCTAETLRNFLVPPGTLRDLGYPKHEIQSVKEMREKLTIPQLLKFGYSLLDLYDGGMRLKELVDAGIGEEELFAVGFSRSDLIRAG